MKILLFGKFGQLGWELNRSLATLGPLAVLDYPEIDLSQPESIRAIIRAAEAQVIVNATAYTAVDKAESEQELADAINHRSVAVMAEEAAQTGAALVHFSTDYVFDGRKGSPYVESDTVNPLNVYGSSKLAGEQAIQAVGGSHLIFRTSWVFSNRRDSFVSKVLAWSRQQQVLRVVDDQISGPTWCRHLAEISAQLLAKAGADPFRWVGERSGVYHLAGWGHASRLDWAKQILAFDAHQEEQVTESVAPAKTSDFPTPAERPLYSALDCTKFEQTFGLRLPDWQVSLQQTMEGIS